MYLNISLIALHSMCCILISLLLFKKKRYYNNNNRNKTHNGAFIFNVHVLNVSSKSKKSVSLFTRLVFVHE